MQNLTAQLPNETVVLAKASRRKDLDAMANPVHAQNWVSMCERSPKLLERFGDLYVAAQLTLLGSGTALELQ